MIHEWAEQVLAHPDLCEMGHHQRQEDNNLGLGWVYYGLARSYRPRHVICIGSWRGFVPMMFAKGMADNLEGGVVTFIDPSYVDDFWRTPANVNKWFQQFGLNNVRHFALTTQDFVQTMHYENLQPVDMLFVDGYHTADQARFDHEAFAPLLTDQAVVLFHDSLSSRPSTIYGEEHTYNYSVCQYLAELAACGDYQTFDIPITDGLTLVRKVR